MRSNECEEKAISITPNQLTITSPDAVGHPCCQGSLLAQAHFAAPQDLQGLFSRAAPKQSGPGLNHWQGIFTESQNGWGSKGPLEVNWSNLSAQAGSPKVGCPGPCLDCFRVSLKMETLQPLQATCAHAQSPPCVTVCAHCLLSSHWAALKRTWLHLLFYPLFKLLYTLMRLAWAFFTEHSQLSQLFFHRRDASSSLGSPELDTALQCGLTSAEQRRSIPSLNMLTTLLQTQLRISLAFFASRAHWWLVFATPGVQFCTCSCWISYCPCWPNRLQPD